MNRPIVHDPQRLNQRAQPASNADLPLAHDLCQTLRAHQENCVGMAANMIGVNKRLIAILIGSLAVPMLNPQIVKRSSPYSATEGCLSLPGETTTTRYRHITVTYRDQQFQPQQQEFHDWIAQIIQHEIDHCNGILI